MKSALTAEVTVACQMNALHTHVHECLNSAFCQINTETTESGLQMDLMQNCPHLAMDMDSAMMSSLSSTSGQSGDEWSPGDVLTKVADLGKKVVLGYHNFKNEKRTAEKNLYCRAAKDVLNVQKDILDKCKTAADNHSST